MKEKHLILIDVIGYLGFWISGSIFFLIYFKIYNVSMDMDNTIMIKSIPPLLSIIIVSVCSFASFSITTGFTLKKISGTQTIPKLFQIGLLAMIFSIVMDLLVAIVIQKVNILIFPINVMYLLAWGIIIPAMVWVGYRKTAE